MQCEFCKYFLDERNICNYCNFEYDEKYNPFDKDYNWDIFDLKEEDDWEHIQILKRLHSRNVDCIFVDIWFGDNTAVLIGCFENPKVVAEVLNLHEESVYGNTDNGLIVLNLFQEKYIRGMIE